MSKKYLFGWSNISFLIKEFVKMYSGGNSFFSKKRIESGIAFIVLQWGAIYYLVHKLDTITMSDFLLWSGVQLAIVGYTMNMIQAQKKDTYNTTPDKV
jgi:hypothetical protein